MAAVYEIDKERTDMKSSRLFQILYLLMERRAVTAGMLAERLEVSVRTIYRDLDALSAAGIPVYAQKGQGGGIRLMEEFKMDRSLLSGEQQEQILTALQSLDSVGAIEGSSLLTQMSGLFGKKAVGWLEVDFGSWGAMKKEKEYFEICREAILHCRLLSFEYFNSSGGWCERTVEPLKLCFKGGNWYVSGYCRRRRGFRLFRLSRILKLCIEDETFTPKVYKEGERPEPVQEMIPMKIRFSGEASFQVMDFFAPDDIEVEEDGTLLVNTAFPPGIWIKRFLLSFGALARVIEPEWVCRELLEEAEKIRMLYDI